MRANCGKFALMDGVILIAAFGLGMYLATHFMRTETDGRFDTICVSLTAIPMPTPMRSRGMERRRGSSI